MDRLFQTMGIGRGDGLPLFMIAALPYCYFLRWVARSKVGRQIWIALILLFITACGNESMAAPTPVITRLMAELLGELVVVEGCVRVNSVHSGTSQLLVWPSDHVISVIQETVQVTDGSGKKVTLRIGDTVSGAGGEVRSAEYLDERVRQTLPAHCPGPYWVVGSEITPIESVK